MAATSLVANESPQSPGGGFGLFGRSSDDVKLRYRLVDLSYAFVDEPDVHSQVSLERGSASFFLPFADIVVGRQAISFGKAYF